ncbi:MAG TPA: hypothetical protein VMS93_13620 [Candidatus Saccharimonadales bacterium]|nr:hypothetical protein [Candidatus Saccharimonadales bacterium]
MTPESQDQEHLRLLSLFHYVLAGITGAFSLFPLIHLFIGIAMLAGPIRPPATGTEPIPMAMLAWIFIVGAALFILLGLSMAVCMALTGKYLAGGCHYGFCFAIAVSELLCMPLGTVLGVFTILVLSRESVQRRFGRNIPPAVVGGA